MSGISDPRLKDYWQYCFRVYHMNHFSGSKRIETEQELNQLGSERWECLSVVGNGDFLIYNFKRLMTRM